MRARPAAAAGVAASLLVWVASLVACLPVLGDETGRTVVWVRGGTLLGVDVATHLDALAAPVVLLATTVGLLVQVYSTTYLEGDPRYPSYAALVVLFTVAMVVVVAADDLVLLLVGWEVMGICSYLLIGHHHELRDARHGAVVAFLTTRVGDVGLIVAVVALGAHHGTYRVSGVVEAVGASPGAGVHLLAGLLLLLAVLAKSAQLPFQAWLPAAMPGPTPVSALIHAATMVAAGVYLLARLRPLLEATVAVPVLLACLSALTMLLAALFALVATDLKRVLAWSTVSQLAYMFAALATGHREAALAHLVSHGAFKALLFLAAGVVAHAVGSTALSAMGGLRRRLPVAAWTAAVGFAALAGLAPTAGFLTKDAVVDGALVAALGGEPSPVPRAVAALVAAAALATVVLTAAYAVRAWWSVFGGPVAEPAAEPVAATTPADEPWTLTGPLIVLAGTTFVLALGQPLHLATGVLTTVLVLAGGAVAVRALRGGRDPADLLGPGRRVAAAELGAERAADALGRGVVRLARGVTAADRDVVDLYPRGGAAAARLAARLADRAVTGNVQTYATVLASAVVVAVAVGVLR